MNENGRMVFGNDLLSINNQNLEEDEELEDRKRREEEIHNLLSHAMGEFNYDDQSTINSSVASSVGGAHGNILQPEVRTAFEQQYREANADEQSKVLYEVRVREVMALSKELETLRTEFKEQEQSLKKKVVLLEIENERKNLSLKESQDLLAGKIGQIKNLEGQIQYIQNKTKNLELNLVELNQDNTILREANMKLEQQIALMDRGFPLLNKTSDRELQESQRTRIAQLEDSLARTIEQNECKERQYKEVVRELKQDLEEKHNNLAEKGILINKLTENFDYSQRQCQELLKTVDELKQSQKTIEHYTEGPLEEELRKIREQNERADILRENIKKAISDEFQVHIANLTSENIKVKDTLLQKEKEFEETEHQLQKMSYIQNENESLQRRSKELEDQLIKVNTELSRKFADCEKERDYLQEKQQNLTDTLRKLENENEVLHQKIKELEHRKHSIEEKLIQTSFLNVDVTELTKLQEEKEEASNELVAAHSAMKDLENRLKFTLQENSQLKIKVDLEQERDVLIKQLQEKATQFEKLIFEKQRKLIETEMSSIGINTDAIEDVASVLKVKYDASLYKTETSLRKNLKQEFDEKLEKIINEFNEKLKFYECQNCEKMIDERARDRELVGNLADKWLEKFQILEKETQSEMVALKSIYQHQLAKFAMKLEKEYTDKYKALVENMKVVSADLGNRNNKLLQHSIKGNRLLSEGLGGVVKCIQQGNEEIAEIKKQYSQRRAALEKNIVAFRL